MEPLLKVKNLSVAYPGTPPVHVLENVSFDVCRGEILGIIGESGSGKTTIAYSILNLLPKDARVSGHIIFEDHDVLFLKESQLCTLRGKKIGLIPQEPAAAFNPVFSIGYQFDEFLQAKNICAQRRERRILMERSLERVRIKDPVRILKSYPHQLSGGQLQRAMIALVVAARPSLVIADEPTSSLDVTIESQLVHMFLRLRDELGLTIIFITHNLGLIDVLCDRVAVLYKGRIKELGEKASVISTPQDVYTKSLVSSFNAIEG